MDLNEDKIDLTQYFNRFYISLRKLKKWLLLLIVVCFLFMEIRTMFFFETTYSSRAVFIAYQSEQTNIFSQSDDNDDLVTTFNRLLTGNMMQEIICQELNVSSVPGQISLSRLTDTNLINLTVTAADPQDAYDVINCIINNYGQVTEIVMSDVSLSLLDTPQLATSPDAYPDYIKSGIYGIVIGVGLSFILPLIYTLIRRTILNDKDVKKYLHLENITRIPYISSSKKYGRQQNLLLSNPRIQYQFKQSFSDIRLKIEQSHKKDNTQVIMFSSTMPNEGKTISAINTAIALAEKKYKVVLVDLDLRNPSIYQMLKGQNISGNIIDYLKNNFLYEEIINPYKDYSLDIIYGVHSSMEAPELLSKEKLHELIIKLKQEYDYVVLDVPPLYMMDDALLVAPNIAILLLL